MQACYCWRIASGIEQRRHLAPVLLELGKTQPIQVLRDGSVKISQKKKHALAQQRYARKQRPEWHVWRSMKNRCYDKSHLTYPYYGGRGITVCDRWLEHGRGFKNFLEDMGARPSKGFDLDRIDSDKGYSKENCQWVPRGENRKKSRGCFCSHREDEVPF